MFEDAAIPKSWVGGLGRLPGTMLMQHFVSLLDGRVRFESATFSAPYSWGHLRHGRTMLPRNEWTPGMNEALDELGGGIAADRWVLARRSEQAWQDHYRRQTVRSTRPVPAEMRDICKWRAVGPELVAQARIPDLRLRPGPWSRRTASSHNLPRNLCQAY